jgi:RHS repeat-associated protein
MGRVTRSTWTVLGQPFQLYNLAVSANPLLEQAWTPDGLPASLKDANGNTTAFAYDRFDRLATTTYPLGSTEAFTWDANGNVLTRKTRANDTITFTYDGLDRLTTKTPPSGPVVTYGYDLAGRLKSVSDTSAAIPSVAMPGSTTTYGTSYAYDALNRLTGAAWEPVPTATPPAPGDLVTFAHSYNAVNQRVGQTVSDNTWLSYPAGVRTTAYDNTPANPLNQYTSIATTGEPTITPTYDANGNLTSDGTYTLGYDVENRLVSASGAGNTASYQYDAQGRRKARTVNGTTTISITDADNREVLEYDGATGAVLRWYAYGLGPNDVLGQMNLPAGTRSTLLPDLLDSIIGSIASGTGALTKSAYQPYGGSAAASPFGFTGQRFDPESGFYAYRTRHYSPAWGRFLQADPLGYAAGANLYAYVANDPLNWVDPWGLAREPSGVNTASPAPPVAVPVAAGGAGGGGGSQGPPPPVAAAAAGGASGGGGNDGGSGGSGNAGGGNGGGPKLPSALQTGHNAQFGVDVYYGIRNGLPVYCGISCNIAQRLLQHRGRFDELREVTLASVTRGQARAIEQALIVRNPNLENIRNSISHSHAWYQQAVRWGEWWLRVNGY